MSSFNFVAVSDSLYYFFPFLEIAYEFQKAANKDYSLHFFTALVFAHASSELLL